MNFLTSIYWYPAVSKNNVVYRICLEALIDPLFVEHNYAAVLHSKLVCNKNRGGLIRASKSVFRVLEASENALISITDNFKYLQVPNIKLKIVNNIKNTFIDKAAIYIRLHTYGRFHQQNDKN